MKSTTKEIIHQGNSRISVESLPDYAWPVVIKIPAKRHPSIRSLRTLENEYEMTRTLDGVEGVRKVLEHQSIDSQPALILEYVDGETLRDTIARQTLDLRSKLEIAVNLTRVLGNIHQLNVIHLDLNSKNILIRKDQASVQIIDLSSASYINRSGHQKVRSDQLLGTLPYISPEQTGRINRVVDERSDLYSLGVVLYELMTRQLPFDLSDPLQLVHDHIARVPVSPTELSTAIPEILSAIILKLLSKNAEDRYQSATGVQADLDTCLQRLSPADMIEDFPLGEVDDASRFKYPQTLYGRQGDLKILEEAFGNACRRTSSMLFVGGYSGIGKTVLVEELQPTVSQNGGYFVRGKFDQYLRTTPYAAISQAFAEFVSLILTEPDTNFDLWQREIQASVGDLGQVLIDVVPTLEELIGTQPDIPQLGGQEAENRFNYVFTHFLTTVATEEHPLVLFIDDLQWIDAASLRLLKVIQSEVNRSGLLVMGAYRDNEVDTSHPLMGLLDHQEESGIPIQILKLAELEPQHVERLLADTLRASEGVPALGTTIYEKTHGNPFFLRRLLTSLNEEGRFQYDPDTTSWQWDLEDINSEAISDNVADLLARMITQLSERTNNTLSLAACIGNSFDLPTLVLISGLPEKDVIHLLNASLSGQYIRPSGDAYVFVHDQVQQAAYCLLDAEDRKAKHLEIGRLLLADTAETELNDRIFDIVAHYNLSADLLTDPVEKTQLTELNLIAGRKAKVNSAFAASTAYLRQGLALLSENCWQDHFELSLCVHNELIDACFLNIEYEEVDRLYGTILDHAKREIDTCNAYKTMILTMLARNELVESISLADRYLEKLRISFLDAPGSFLSEDELLDLPPIRDKEKEAALEIMMAITTPTYLAATDRLPSLAYTMVNTINQYGHNHVSGPAYTWYSLIQCFDRRFAVQRGEPLQQTGHQSARTVSLLRDRLTGHGHTLCIHTPLGEPSSRPDRTTQKVLLHRNAGRQFRVGPLVPSESHTPYLGHREAPGLLSRRNRVGSRGQ
ncbi:MAG: serine/threonine-protein kinase PknK [Chloroflexi bacterium]|nr:serine/threonine-protein kinase PknK [Chloroflexota bacterium]